MILSLQKLCLYIDNFLSNIRCVVQWNHKAIEGRNDNLIDTYVKKKKILWSYRRKNVAFIDVIITMPSSPSFCASAPVTSGQIFHISLHVYMDPA